MKMSFIVRGHRSHRFVSVNRIARRLRCLRWTAIWTSRPEYLTTPVPDSGPIVFLFSFEVVAQLQRLLVPQCRFLCDPIYRELRFRVRAPSLFRPRV